MQQPELERISALLKRRAELLAAKCRSQAQGDRLKTEEIDAEIRECEEMIMGMHAPRNGR